jgi:hypothetical protein
MHDWHIAPSVIFGADLARVSQSRFLFDRQSIQFCAKHYRWSGAIF